MNAIVSPRIGILALFHAFVFLVVAVDLGWLRRRAHRVSVKEASLWSAIWVVLAFGFATLIWTCWAIWQPGEEAAGADRTVEFLTGYLIELALSVDNLFVFLVIFRYFRVPEELQHRVLVWGILGAVIMRGAMILAGAALLHFSHWVTYLFGAFLLVTGLRFARAGEPQVDPGKNMVLRGARRWLPVRDEYVADRFWTRQDGRWQATPLLFALIVVETSDVVFATDSIPAIFGVTLDPFIVYTSNIFAVLGLRSMYFLLAGVVGRLRYLSLGLGLVLAFIGAKMLIQGWYAIPILPALAVVALVLGACVIASLVRPKEIAHE